jgi:hypothetical protein
MTVNDITTQRLLHQQLVKTSFKQPHEIVSWFGAMQSQDYASSKWAIGARLPGLREAAVDRALLDRSVIRTTAFRGTLHLVAAADLRWMLQLVAPAVKARMAGMSRSLGLDERLFGKTGRIIAGAMQGGNHLTRKELVAVLEEKGVNTTENRMNLIIYRASLDALICNGPMKGKQFTYTLLDEWSPGGAVQDREASLAILARRYFTSHGPATVQDFAQWAGLTLTDAKAGLEAAEEQLQAREMNGAVYRMAPGKRNTARDTALLLPAFDEYFIGYKDRSTVMDMRYAKSVMTINGIFNPIMVRNGQVMGAWKRTIKKDTVSIITSPFKSLTKAGLKAFEPAAQQYADFLGLKLAAFS